MSMSGVLVVSALVSATWLFFVLVHLGALVLFRVRESLILGFMAAAGPAILWRLTGSITVSGEPVPNFLKTAALFLYWAGCIGYVEILSLLSRGISFRVLLDLLRNNGAADLKTLSLSYGDGMGLKGLLAKRLHSLSRAGFLHYQENQVGPPTFLGRLFGGITSGMRTLLRLQQVG